MYTHTMILKNTTSSGIYITDLAGLYIPASGTIDITDLFQEHRLYSSDSLNYYITNSGVVLNVDGSDLYNQRAKRYLSPHDSTYIQGIPVGDVGTTYPENIIEDKLVKFKKNENKFELEQLSFLELNDAPTTYSGYSGFSVVVNPSENSLEYGTAVASSINASYDPPTNSGTGSIWFNLNYNELYYYDQEKGKWLSVNTYEYLFSYNASIGNAYLAVGNVSASFAHYSLIRPATIVNIIAHGESGNDTKGFDVLDKNTQTVFYTFNLSNYTFQDFDLNVDLPANTELQIFVHSAGQGIKYPIIQLRVKRSI